jgi:hypothetical protein
LTIKGQIQAVLGRMLSATPSLLALFLSGLEGIAEGAFLLPRQPQKRDQENHGKGSEND